MSAKSNDRGRAFEYACVLELKTEIERHRPVRVDVESVSAAKRAWETQPPEEQAVYLRAADAFAETLFAAEPLILESENGSDILTVSINRDSDAQAGDVRDIILARNTIRWDIGLSMKHNHFAARHSRLSPNIDFGAKWYGLPCTDLYWEAITPIFAMLRKLKGENVLWRNMTNKARDIYAPLLNAFMDELDRAFQEDSAITKRLMSYLLGIKDFYKVVAVDKKERTEFQAFNLRGELNHNGRRTKRAIVVPVADLPDEIIKLRFKPGSENTVELYLNKGWALSFRIHNASEVVEPSLKFDIQFLGVPANIITINCAWR